MQRSRARKILRVFGLCLRLVVTRPGTSLRNLPVIWTLRKLSGSGLKHSLRRYLRQLLLERSSISIYADLAAILHVGLAQRCLAVIDLEALQALEPADIAHVSMSPWLDLFCPTERPTLQRRKVGSLVVWTGDQRAFSWLLHRQWWRLIAFQPERSDWLNGFESLSPSQRPACVVMSEPMNLAKLEKRFHAIRNHGVILAGGGQRRIHIAAAVDAALARSLCEVVIVTDALTRRGRHGLRSLTLDLFLCDATERASDRVLSACRRRGIPTVFWPQQTGSLTASALRTLAKRFDLVILPLTDETRCGHLKDWPANVVARPLPSHFPGRDHGTSDQTAKGDAMAPTPSAIQQQTLQASLAEILRLSKLSFRREDATRLLCFVAKVDSLQDLSTVLKQVRRQLYFPRRLVLQTSNPAVKEAAAKQPDSEEIVDAEGYAWEASFHTFLDPALHYSPFYATELMSAYLAKLPVFATTCVLKLDLKTRPAESSTPLDQARTVFPPYFEGEDRIGLPGHFVDTVAPADPLHGAIHCD